MSDMRTYMFHLPVFKQGDDLASALTAADTVSGGLLVQEQQYLAAAAMCRALAEKIGKNSEVEIHADTHMIMVAGPSGLLDPLCEGDDALLEPDPFSEDEEEEYGDFV